MIRNSKAVASTRRSHPLSMSLPSHPTAPLHPSFTTALSATLSVLDAPAGGSFAHAHAMEAPMLSVQSLPGKIPRPVSSTLPGSSSLTDSFSLMADTFTDRALKDQPVLAVRKLPVKVMREPVRVPAATQGTSSTSPLATVVHVTSSSQPVPAPSTLYDCFFFVACDLSWSLKFPLVVGFFFGV
jgi:hypothetical protein